LEGTLDGKRMVRFNAEAERTKNYTRAANLYFESGAGSGNTACESFPQKLARWTLRHLQLAGFSLMLSVIFGIPLGIVASRGGAIGQTILGFASVVQTIPALALLALLVPLPFFGISIRTAIAALFLYGLLQHRERSAGYPAVVARIRRCIGTQPVCPALGNLSADGVPFDFIRN